SRRSMATTGRSMTTTGRSMTSGRSVASRPSMTSSCSMATGRSMASGRRMGAARSMATGCSMATGRSMASGCRMGAARSMATGCSVATGSSMAPVRRMTTARPMSTTMTAARMSRARARVPRMSVGMKTSWDAATTMFECAPVVLTKMPMIVDRPAVRNIIVATKHHGPATPGRRPRAETPAEASKDPNRDGREEAKSDSHHDAGRRWQHNKARVGDNEPSPDAPGIVIGNVNHRRIDRHNIDHAGIDNHLLLRRRNQHVRLLRLQPHGLDSVHDVSGLVVIGVAELRRPGAVLREIIEDGGKRREALDGRVPIHGVRRGRALIRGQSHVLVQPGVRCGNLVRIRGASQYLSDQRVWIESNRGHELIQLLRVQLDIGTRRGRIRVQI